MTTVLWPVYVLLWCNFSNSRPKTSRDDQSIATLQYSVRSHTQKKPDLQQLPSIWCWPSTCSAQRGWAKYLGTATTTSHDRHSWPGVSPKTTRYQQAASWMMPQPSAVSTIYAPLPKTRKRGPTTQPLSLEQTMTDMKLKLRSQTKNKKTQTKNSPNSSRPQRLQHPIPSQTQRPPNQPFNTLQVTYIRTGGL